ncbi:hypothetical protein XELAEV_18022698mg [Xenopus laevis]|uniref:Uncharacterized protein n=1 Tax=Xenopus laevis TaxID=8355 RepID=A0A974HNM9_XENLA|nr:hypothetical protein XELAEV_18022698mg [Xenopus laevis]
MAAPLVQAVRLLQQRPTSLLFAGIGAFFGIQQFFSMCGCAGAVGSSASRRQRHHHHVILRRQWAAEREAESWAGTLVWGGLKKTGEKQTGLFLMLPVPIYG